MDGGFRPDFPLAWLEAGAGSLGKCRPTLNRRVLDAFVCAGRAGRWLKWNPYTGSVAHSACENDGFLGLAFRRNRNLRAFIVQRAWACSLTALRSTEGARRAFRLHLVVRDGQRRLRTDMAHALVVRTGRVSKRPLSGAASPRWGGPHTAATLEDTVTGDLGRCYAWPHGQDIRLETGVGS